VSCFIKVTSVLSYFKHNLNRKYHIETSIKDKKKSI